MDSAVPDEAAQSIATSLATYAATLALERIPAPIAQAARLFMLDTLAVAWAGSDAPGCPALHRMLAADGGPDQACAWGHADRLPVGDAAFLNAATASALDYDSLGRDAPVHVNVVVLPAALAVAQWQRASGRDFLAALVAGCDITCRIAASMTPPHRGFAYTSVAGVIGAAAAAARLMRLDGATTRHALGLAFLQAGGTQQANIEPTLAKRLLAAFPARAGVLAARLAAAGFTAPASVFEGECGLYALYQPGNPTRLTEALGQRFDSDALSIKAYPSCGCNHTAIAGTLALAHAHDLAPEDVVAVEATVTPYMARIVGSAYDPGEDPQAAAQFSLTYSIACALVRRRLGLAEIEAEAATDPRILALVPRIVVKVNADWTGTRGPVLLRLHSRRHGWLERRVDHVPGTAESPLDPAAIDAKIAECLGRGARPLDTVRIARLRERVESLHEIEDMDRFFEGIV
jgi:2-methylcitrate dehydratase PrpD